MSRTEIRAIIEGFRAEGTDGGVVVCPFCGGGSRKRRTLSVNRRDGVWLWLCHRARCNVRGAMAGDPREILGLVQGKPPDVKPFREPTRLPQLGTDPIADRVVSLIGDRLTDFAAQWGLRVLRDDPSTHVWICRDLNDSIIGHVTRNPAKVIKTYREAPRFVYAAFLPPHTGTNDHPLVVVEDHLSAALLADEGLPAVALNGTNMSDDLADEIRNWSLRRDKKVIVALDPDDAGNRATPRVMDKLRNMGGHPIAWSLVRDVAKLAPYARKYLVERMIEATT